MEINTKYFGNIQVNETDQITFEKGLFGFEENKSFFILSFDDVDDTLLCLQSAEEPYLAFVLFNPFSILGDYDPNLTDKDLEELGANADTPLTFYAIAVLRDDFRDTTLNLKCPVVINMENKLAKQVMLEGSSYSLRHPMVTAEKEA